ncbi:UNVERIFIED_CONTAM: hypothetical protein Sindi_1797500, partial [Sesamum indicum]
ESHLSSDANARSCPPTLVHPPLDYPSVSDSATPPAAGYAYDLAVLEFISQDYGLILEGLRIGNFS